MTNSKKHKKHKRKRKKHLMTSTVDYGRHSRTPSASEPNSFGDTTGQSSDWCDSGGRRPRSPHTPPLPTTLNGWHNFLKNNREPNQTPAVANDAGQQSGAHYFKPDYAKWLASQTPNSCLPTNPFPKPNRDPRTQNPAYYTNINKVKFTIKAKPSVITDTNPLTVREKSGDDNDIVNRSPISRPRTHSSESDTDSVTEKESIPDKYYDRVFEDYRSDGIIKTYNRANRELYYCGYCDVYRLDRHKLDVHVKLHVHKSNLRHNPRSLNLYSGLNQRFAPKLRSSSIRESEKQTIIEEINRVPVEAKHYYCRRGIQLVDGRGRCAYYCQFCDESMASFDDIEPHLWCESHRAVESIPTFDRLFLRSPEETVTGLDYLVEYGDALVYECQLCEYFAAALEMFDHYLSYKHRVNLLRVYFPAKVEQFRLESPELYPELENKMRKLLKWRGPGVMRRLDERDIPANQRSIVNNIIENKSQSERVSHKAVAVSKLWRVRLTSESDASRARDLMDRLNESIVRYELRKIPLQTRLELAKQIRECEDNYEVCEMDTSP